MINIMITKAYSTLLYTLSLFSVTCLANAQVSERKAISNEGNSEWVNLLENDSLALWQSGRMNHKSQNRDIGTQWSLENGILNLDKEKKGRGGYIITKKSYFNFELQFEFKISVKGNSGVKYRINEKGLGLEYQILDDVLHSDGKKPSHRSASMYELVAAPDTKKHHPAGGELWNRARIVAKGNLLEHWLNGEKVVSIEFGSEDWKKRFANSKYKVIPGFAESAGPILLQDHTDPVSFRNIRIREFN